jgi:hypothetical protein
MNTEKTDSIDSILWLKWTLATTLGLFITDYLSFVVGDQIPIQFFELLYYLATGLFIGTLQWLFVLRSRLVNSQQWIWFSAIGWAIGDLFYSPSVFVLSLFLRGIILGFSQWFFFMRKVYPKSFVWVLVNAFALPLTYTLSVLMLFFLMFDDSIVFGILFGAITGFSLMWLISQSQKSTGTMLPSI